MAQGWGPNLGRPQAGPAALVPAALLLILVASQINIISCTENTYNKNGGGLCRAAGGKCRPKAECDKQDLELLGQPCRRHNFLCCKNIDNEDALKEIKARGSKAPAVVKKKPHFKFEANSSNKNSNINGRNRNIALNKENSKTWKQFPRKTQQKQKNINIVSENGAKIKEVPQSKATNSDLRKIGDQKKKRCKKASKKAKEACSKKGGKCRKKIKKETNQGCKDQEIVKGLCGKKWCKKVCCTTKRNTPLPDPPKPVVCNNETECTENNGICIPNSDVCLTGLVNYVRCHSSYCKCCMAPDTEKTVTTMKTVPRYPECPKNPDNTPETCITCGIVNGPKASRVTGGVPVDIPNKFPWLVWIEYNEKHWCGGSIVNNQFVLTAATCICISCKVISAQEFSIVIADHNRNSKFVAQGITCKVKAEEVILHPDFTACSKSPHTHDLALIKLSATLSFPAGSVLKPVCLPISSNANYDGDSAIVSGWGLTSPNTDYPDLPHEVNITVLDNTVCNKRYWYYNETYMLCAGATNQVKDACIGDAGAPLIGEVKQGTYSVIGIVSGGHPQCIGPGVYTRVDKYLDWIKKTADQSKIC